MYGFSSNTIFDTVFTYTSKPFCLCIADLRLIEQESVDDKDPACQQKIKRPAQRPGLWQLQKLDFYRASFPPFFGSQDSGHCSHGALQHLRDNPSKGFALKNCYLAGQKTYLANHTGNARNASKQWRTTRSQLAEGNKREAILRFKPEKGLSSINSRQEEIRSSWSKKKVKRAVKQLSNYEIVDGRHNSRRTIS